MKKYKLILNLGSTEEKTSYFERLSTKKLLTIIKDKNNLLLEFDDFFNCYLPLSYNLTAEQKNIYEKNKRFYCERF